jgi:inorganic pyrophosphatase
VLGVDTPIESYSGICVAVIVRLNDQDDKLVVVSPGTELDDELIRKLTHFQERFFTSRIVRAG